MNAERMGVRPCGRLAIGVELQVVVVVVAVLLLLSLSLSLFPNRSLEARPNVRAAMIHGGRRSFNGPSQVRLTNGPGRGQVFGAGERAAGQQQSYDNFALKMPATR